MPHPSPIIDLCQHSRVTWDDNKELLKVRVLIVVYDRILVSRAGSVIKPQNEASGSGQPQQRSTPLPMTILTNERLVVLEWRVEMQRLRLDSHCRRIEGFMASMTDFTSALAKWFHSAALKTSHSCHHPFGLPTMMIMATNVDGRCHRYVYSFVFVHWRRCTYVSLEVIFLDDFWMFELVWDSWYCHIPAFVFILMQFLCLV